MTSTTNLGNRSLNVRRELTLVSLVAALFLLTPLVTGELYPFTSASMFARRPELTCRYTVYDHRGDELSPRPFGLSRNNPHDPPATTLGRNGYGRRQPESLNGSGIVATEADVRTRVTAELRNRPRIPYVVVRQAVHGADDSGVVGHVQTLVWRIENPTAKASADPGATAPPCRAAARSQEMRR